MQDTTGEQVIKSWDYAKTKGVLFTKQRFNLTLTNRRLISSTTSNGGFSSNAIELYAIKGVSATYNKSGSLLKLLFNLIFLWIAIMTIILIPFAIMRFRSQASLEILLCTDGDDYDFLYSDGIKKEGFFARLFGKRKVRMVVDPDVARDIVDNLSTLVLRAKMGNITPLPPSAPAPAEPTATNR